jgi:hypothetical protein
MRKNINIYLIKQLKEKKQNYIMDNLITNLKKQNEGMETAFKNKNIEFTKLSIDDVDPETELKLLKDYNNYLKIISSANRPPQQEKPKIEKSKIEKKQETPKKSKDDDEDEDVVPKEVKPVYSTITNMEDIKRTFFNKDYESFNNLVKQHPFKYYKVNYKYSSDNNGRAEYIAKNLLRGFIQGLDDYRKYLMVCFRCILVNKEIKEYKYPSYWILNSNDDVKNILGSLYDDYDFILVEEDEAIDNLLKKMEKNEDDNDDNLVGEVYLH